MNKRQFKKLNDLCNRRLGIDSYTAHMAFTGHFLIIEHETGLDETPKQFKSLSFYKKQHCVINFFIENPQFMDWKND